MVVCFVSLSFSSAFFVLVTGDATPKINNDFLDNNLQTAGINLTDNSEFIETETLSSDFAVYDFLFWRTGSTYYVQNGLTGEIDFFGPDISVLVETVVSESTDGLLLCFRSGVYVVFLPLTSAKKVTFVWLGLEGG